MDLSYHLRVMLYDVTLDVLKLPMSITVRSQVFYLKELALFDKLAELRGQSSTNKVPCLNESSGRDISM